MAKLRFGDINFGFASAEMEGAESPNLLLDGFFDIDGVREKLIEERFFLCLGYKGSGKSAISEHLRLVADGRPDMFVRRMFLAEFPFVDFGNILRGSQDVAARYPPTWSWLLYLQILDSLASDAGATSSDQAPFDRTVGLLRRYGLLPTPSLHEIVLKSSEKSFRVSLGKTLEGGRKGTLAVTGDLNFLTFVDALRKAVTSTRSESRHFLVIDGLDDILLREPVQYEALAALVIEVARLNELLRDAGAPAKVILLCRNDIYAQLPGPNLNKVRTDSSIQLDWHSDPQHPETSDLVTLANAKARVSDPKLEDLFGAFLPMTVGGKGTTLMPETRIYKFLLERTRHLPRDFLQLLREIQIVAGTTKGRLTDERVLGGARNYSRSYFLSEIRDELAGHFSREGHAAGFDALGMLPAARFTAAEFMDLLGPDSEVDGIRFLRALYDCGAIGNLQNGRYAFRYRNPDVPFNPQATITLHRGLAPAINVPAARARS
jgi:hypothetical protein